MKDFRLANKIVWTLVKNNVQYPARLILDITGIIARCGVLLLLYKYVFDLNAGTIKSTTFDVVAWSMFLYFVLSTLRLRDLAKIISRDIQSGSIEMLFNKPISYLTYRFCWQIGAGLFSFLVIMPIGVLIMAACLGVPATMTSWFFLLTLLIALLGCVVLTLIIYAILGMASFWIIDAAPVLWIVDKFVMVLGGSYLPVAFFPKAMYNLARWSPFGGAQILSQMPYTTWRTDAWMLLTIQYSWILILGAVLIVMFKNARKKLSVNGG